MLLDDDVNPFNSQIEDSERANDISFVHMMNSGEDIIHQQGYENVVFSSSEKSTGEKLPPRKKARTDSYLDKACEEVTEITSQIFGMIQKRWEKEAEEKEADDKANNVWDAINEIPDLDDDLRYEAMTLVHSLGMKSGFVKMSVADRRGWIKKIFVNKVDEVQCIDKGLKCYGWFFRLWSFSIFLGFEFLLLLLANCYGYFIGLATIQSFFIYLSSFRSFNKIFSAPTNMLFLEETYRYTL